MPFFETDIVAFFDHLTKTNRTRTLEAPPANAVDLCSNDYLCLSRHPQLTTALKEGIDRYGAGSTASRLIRGHRDVFDQLETKFASWVGAESALFFANGYAANVGCLSAICDGSYAAFIDRLSHASLVDGVRLSGAQKVYYRHNDVAHLEELLQKNHATKKIIVTESLFSMDGDFARLDDLVQLKEKYNALLYVDEAHALGVYGAQGRGVAPEKTDFRMATLGKALGLEGAMVATSAAARQLLLHSARTFVFSTAPMPAIAHAGLTSIDLVRSMDQQRESLKGFAEKLRTGIVDRGFSAGLSASHIIPVLCASEKAALDLAARAQNAGLHIKAIRPPTVKQSRLRISLNAAVDKTTIDRILNVLQ